MSKTIQHADQEAEVTYSKAAKAELSRDYDVAFRLYVKAAELYLNLSRTHSDDGQLQTAKWKANAGKALQRAEKIKAFVDKRKSVHQPGATPFAKTGDIPATLTPVGINHFSPEEQSFVLKKGAFVNGLLFPLWDQPVSKITQRPFEDPDGQPKLSSEQAKELPVWRRVPPIRSFHTRHRIHPQQILQHIVTDCSVCASISVCLEHSQRFGSNLARAAVYCTGYNNEGSEDMHQSGGRYDIKILFNGDWRRVIVDDRLPYHPVDGTLMCLSVLPPKNDPTADPPLWPSILEKGYMKLMGGYDFPGSNSSIDLHAIAGWIPEHIEIKSSSFEREKTWQRINEGFSRGDCVLTIGTGTNARITLGDVELLSSHSYAVIDVNESENVRTLTVLDTWVNPSVVTKIEEPRLLRVSWSDLLNVFDGIYLSWNPSRWDNKLFFHGMWKRRGHDDETATRQSIIRFTNQTIGEEEIWILLTRHINDSSRTLDYISLKVDLEDDLPARSNLFDQTILATKGTYTNSTHVLVRTKIHSSVPSGIVSIFSSYDGNGMDVGYTLSAYSTSNVSLSWETALPSPPFTTKVDGVFTNKNAGGNCTYPTFMVNPQYHLQIHPRRGPNNSSKARVTLTLQTQRDTPINISLVYSQGGRIDELSENELLASSGAYTYGLARVRKEILPGDSTVILSAFEPRYMGPYTLKIDSSHPFELRPIPQEGAGMYGKVVRGAWTRATSGSGPTSDRYSRNPIFEINIPSPTQLKIRLQLLPPFTPTLLNVTIFPASDRSLQRHIATSGVFNDSISGVATPQISLAAGKYFVIPSTYNPGVEAGFQLIVYTTVAGTRVDEKVG